MCTDLCTRVLEVWLAGIAENGSPPVVLWTDSTEIPHLSSHKRPCLASPVPIGGKIEHSLMPSEIDFPILPVHAISVSPAKSTAVSLSLGLREYRRPKMLSYKEGSRSAYSCFSISTAQSFDTNQRARISNLISFVPFLCFSLLLFLFIPFYNL
jgi:hypothetical protein